MYLEIVLTWADNDDRTDVVRIRGEWNCLTNTGVSRLMSKVCVWENVIEIPGEDGAETTRDVVLRGYPLGGFKDILCRVQARSMNYIS